MCIRDSKQAALAKLEAARCAVTVGQVADDYFERIILGRWKHPNIVRSRIERNIKPHIGGLGVDAVKPGSMRSPVEATRCRGVGFRPKVVDPRYPTTADGTVRSGHPSQSSGV